MRSRPLTSLQTLFICTFCKSSFPTHFTGGQFRKDITMLLTSQPSGAQPKWWISTLKYLQSLIHSLKNITQFYMLLQSVVKCVLIKDSVIFPQTEYSWYSRKISPTPVSSSAYQYTMCPSFKKPFEKNKAKIRLKGTEQVQDILRTLIY